jgi:integrase
MADGRDPGHLSARGSNGRAAVFPRFSVDGAEKAMASACKLAEIPRYSPHDLRHRYASLKLREGVPVTDLAAQLGHARKSMTLDTYSHVLVGE